MARIHLRDGADDPRFPFFFRPGDRVQMKSDSRQQGIVVDGTYEGSPPEAGGGAYRVVYQVRRDDQLLFDADQIDLHLSVQEIHYKGYDIEADAQRLASGAYVPAVSVRWQASPAPPGASNLTAVAALAV